MLSDRRKPFIIGHSQAVTLPGTMQISKEGVSMAAGDRLILMDTTGEVPEDQLFQFFMEQVEPAFRRGGIPKAKNSADWGIHPRQAKPVSPVSPVSHAGGGCSYPAAQYPISHLL